MTAYLQPKFSVNVGGPDYSAGWERIFGPKSVPLTFGEALAREIDHPRKFVGVDRAFDDQRPVTFDDLKADLHKIYTEGQLLREWEEEAGEAYAKLRKQYLEWLYGDHVQAPVRLRDYQKRQMAWAEHNFPLKPNAEHVRIATEFLYDQFPNDFLENDTIDDLAYLLAARDHRSYRPLLGIAEEVGELCHAHLKNEQGIRGTPEEWEAKKKDAIGDVLIYLLDYCSREGLDVEECLETAWAEVSKRDWIRFPKNGKTE